MSGKYITTHFVDGEDPSTRLTVGRVDEPGSGGAYHHYRIVGMDHSTNPSYDDHYPMDHQEVLFQNGPIKEAGVNGVTQEALLAIVIDRLECFQAGPFASEYNAKALQYARYALEYLQLRTRDRIRRDVEGKSEA